MLQFSHHEARWPSQKVPIGGGATLVVAPFLWALQNSRTSATGHTIS